MRKMLCKGMLYCSLALFSCQVLALNLHHYEKHLDSLNDVDGTAHSTILSIIGGCGNSTSLDSDCVLQGLSRVSTEENNSLAKSIATVYEKALGEGNYETLPECQSETNLQVNRNLGHCVFLMYYYALKNEDHPAAAKQYETCLQGGMLGLAYQGNLAAQRILGKIFDERGMEDTATLWLKVFEQRKGTEEYDLALKCYG